MYHFHACILRLASQCCEHLSGYKYLSCLQHSIMEILCISFVVTITTPPENTTVCRGSNVTISCGYESATALPVTWIINGTSFTQQEIVNSPLYQQNNPSSPMTTSLKIFSISDTTTFQCVVLSCSNKTTSTCGTVTVTNGTYKYVNYKMI